MTSPDQAIPPEATPDAIAECVGVTARRVRMVAAESGVTGSRRGILPVGPMVRAFLAQAKKARDGDALSAAKAARENAKARLIELQVAKSEGALIDVTEHLAVIDEIVGLFLAALSALPARISRTDIRERRRIEQVCDTIRDELTEKAAQRATELGGGRP